jgi:hypothetical protein
MDNALINRAMRQRKYGQLAHPQQGSVGRGALPPAEGTPPAATESWAVGGCNMQRRSDGRDVAEGMILESTP